MAFLMYGVSNLRGGGGAERFFADFYDEYSQSAESKYKLYFIIDAHSISNLRDVKKLSNSKNLNKFKVFSNRYKILLEFFQLYFYILKNKIKIIHVPLYNATYVPLLKRMNSLPSLIRPKLVINIVNCYAAPALANHYDPYHKSMVETYEPLFKNVHVDGYFCWNENFKNYLSTNVLIKHRHFKVQSITSRYSNTTNYYPEKKKNNWVVFASRLDDQKHPQWMLEACLIIKNSNPILLQNWKVKICGDGPLRKTLIEFSIKNDLDKYIDFVIEGEMHKILNYSKIYVSCQDYDNFPSLTMAEAMASGNAIIARNVGQTNLFVRNNENGILIEPDSIQGLSHTLIHLMKNDVLVEKFASKSLDLIKEEHSYKNFKNQIESFWGSLLFALKEDDNLLSSTINE